MNLRSVYNEIMTQHNLTPAHRGVMEKPDLILQGVNPSCGDDYTLQFRMDGDTIVDGMFEGDGCAVSKASVDMMLDLIIGRKKADALRLIDLFRRMIHGEATAEEIEELDEAAILENVSHMPARVKCAILGWRTAEEMFTKQMS